MQPRTDPATTVDLLELERSLVERACWHEDPEAYRQGVHDTVAELRRSTGSTPDRVPDVVAV